MCSTCQGTHSGFFFHSRMFNDASISSSRNSFCFMRTTNILPICPFVFFNRKFLQCSQKEIRKHETTMTLPIYQLNQRSGQLKRNIQIRLWNTHKYFAQSPVKNTFYFFGLNCLFSMGIDKVVCVCVCVKSNKQKILIKN